MGKTQKIALGVIATLIVIIGAFLAYTRFVKNPVTPNNQDNQNQQTNNQDNTVNGEPGRVTDTVVFSPTLSYDGRDLWYFTKEGKLLRLIMTTGVKQEYVLPYDIQPTRIIWPARGSDFIAEIVSGSTKKFLYYSSTSKNFIEYPSNIKNVSFMPDGSHIVYNWVDEKGNSSISVANFDATGFKKAADMPEGNLGKGVFAYNASNPSNQILYYVSFENSQPITIKTSQSNAAVWSPDGKKFVFNKFDQSAGGPNSVLWVGDVAAGASADKKIALTAPVNKAVFDTTGKLVFIAVSEAEGDSLWRYNVETGEKAQLYRPADFKKKTTFSNMLVSPDGRWLYYVNSDQYVYGLDINK
jgi:hypothetical protein